MPSPSPALTPGWPRHLVRIALSALFLALAPAATGAQQPDPPEAGAVDSLRAETVRTEAVMRRWINDVWHGGQLELVPELVAPVYVRHEAGGTWRVTAEQYAERIRALRTRFPELRYEVHDAAVTGNRFWIRYTFRGGPDSTGPWPKRPGLQLYRLEDGKLAETWMLLMPEGMEWTDPDPERAGGGGR